METKLHIDVNGTTTPSPIKIAEYIIGMSSLLTNEPRETKDISLLVEDTNVQEVFTRNDFFNALKKASKPSSPDEEKRP